MGRIIIKPKTNDKHHKDVIVSNPRHIKAAKWNGVFAREKKGFFLLKVERGRIMIGRVLKGRMIEVVYGKKAQDIYYFLIRRKMISKLDTAAYLGGELTKAEYCLKNKKKYVQE